MAIIELLFMNNTNSLMKFAFLVFVALSVFESDKLQKKV